MGKFVVKDAGAGSSARSPEPFAPDIPPDIIFPDQLNRYLRDQIHGLTLENGGLRRSLEETRDELAAARERLAKATQPAPTGRVAETADFKIAQLSKRLREQNAEMESLRTQTKEAEAKLRRLEEKAASARGEEESSSSQTSSGTPSELAEKEKQIKALQDKLQASNSKMCDFRNQYQALKQEMKLAQKVIESEIGEKCSLQDLAKENGNWRGRAQQILALQNKVQALQEQLNNSSTVTENPASSLLRQMEKDRRASYEETSRQLNQRTMQMEELRKKYEAARARNKVLENEVMQAKTKASALAEKGVRDEQLVSALTNQINAFEERGRAQIQCFTKMQENMGKVQRELEVERTKGEQLQRAVSDREVRIRRMEEQIDELRKTLKNRVHDDLGESSNTTADKSTDTSLSPDRMKTSSVADMERIRLLELLGVMNRRLEEARRQQNEAETQLRRERHKNAKLETKIARLELEKVGAMKTGRGSYCHSLNKVGDGATAEEADILARQHIEYLEEECLALKTRIETLQMEKEADFKVLASIGDGRESVVESFGELHNRQGRGSHSDGTSGKTAERRVRLNRRKVHGSPAESVRSTSLRQSSFSSEDFRREHR